MELGRAYERLEHDDELRCGVLFAHGEHFTGGLDLAEVGPALADGNLGYPEDARDPWRNDGKPWTTPRGRRRPGLVHDARHRAAARRRRAGGQQRRALRAARDPARHLPVRWRDDPAAARGGLGQRDALAAHRRRVRRRRGAPHRARPGGHRARARISTGPSSWPSASPPAPRRSASAPPSPQPSAPSPKATRRAAARLNDDMVALLRTEDGAEGMMSFIERRPAKFTGR